MKKLLAFLFFCFLNSSINAQNNPISYSVELNGATATKSTLPFWLYANQFGAVSNDHHIAAKLGVFSDFNTKDTAFKTSYKASFIALKEAKNNSIVDELYASAQYAIFQLDLGVKHPNLLWEGLSSSNGNIVMSTNARSLPGYNVSIPNYTQLPFAKNWLTFKGNYSDYMFTDNRIVTDARLHAKSLYLKYKLNPTLELITGINHYVQWGGTSSITGKQPSSFKDYLRIVTGSSGGHDALGNEEINVLGNHLGNYLLQLNYSGEKTNWNFYYSHIFEDGSGRELQNWRDGLYGVFIDFKQPKAFISHMLTEFTYTKHMSGSNAPDDANGGRGMDNYFNNGPAYNSGWTYFGNTIGSPYFTPTPLDDDGISHGIIDNRFMAFNIGMKGTIQQLPYKLMLSHTTYFGWFNAEYQPKPTQFSGFLEFGLPKINQFPIDITIGTAFDTGTYRPSNLGGFLKLTKRGVF
ncbi:capsule assembly Wzi family protein [Lutibacter sp.]|uniref:capsule assembly Wzi family protein n=1 Tax=Lutibacter sp. TaxID=1925666 RepID=UPI003564A6D8